MCKDLELSNENITDGDPRALKLTARDVPGVISYYTLAKEDFVQGLSPKEISEKLKVSAK